MLSKDSTEPNSLFIFDCSTESIEPTGLVLIPVIIINHSLELLSKLPSTLLVTPITPLKIFFYFSF